MSSKESRRSAREKLAEERRRQVEAERRRSRIINIAIAVVVILAVTTIFVLVQKSRNSGPATATLPKTVTQDGGGVTVGQDSAPVTVDMWLDFQCPNCKQFETVNAPQMAAMTDSGQIRVVYHPLSFLDQHWQNTASALAANAFGCSADYGLAQKYQSTVFANQPPVEGTGYTSDQLIQWGKDIGITDSNWPSCVQDQPYANWVKQVESSMTSQGVTGTPTLFINGQRVSPKEQGPMMTNPAAFKQAVAAAASGG